VGSADPAEQVSVSILLRRRVGAPALPDLSQARASTGGAMSREQFAGTYGADPADIERIETFAGEHGLAVAETSIPRRTVVLHGTVAQMNEAFAVDLGTYQASQHSYRGQEGHVHVPAGLAPLVVGVFGLDNRQAARPLFRVADPAQATQALTPPQVARVYNFPAGKNTASQCIGLLEFGGGYRTADVTAWFGGLGLTPPRLADVSVDGAGNSPGSSPDDDTEVILDIDVAGAVAQDARIAVYFALNNDQGWIDAVSTAVHDTANRPSVISISWGNSEELWAPGTISALSTIFAEAASLGITVLASSGDQGSQASPTKVDGRAHVEYPASDPSVLACGGTTVENVVAGIAFHENLWKPSGGGISTHFPVPFWQDSAGLPASVNDGHHGRGVPDVAGNADPASGYLLIKGGQQFGPVGGTSAAAPLYAGLIALINGQSDFPVGYLNPTLYEKSSAWIFRDITTSGDNSFHGTPGYPVGPGWDATTGLGSIRGTGLRDLLGPGTKVVPSHLTTAVVPGENLLQLFYRGQDNAIWTRWRNPGGNWSGEQRLGGILASNVTAVVIPDTQVVQLFYRGQDNAIWTRWREINGNWSAEQRLGGIVTSDITAVPIPNTGVLQVFYRGQDEAIWTRWREINGNWSPEQRLGGILTSEITAAQIPGTGILQVFYRGQDDAIWSRWRNTDGNWSPEQRIGGILN
jgi:kumamolisin